MRIVLIELSVKNQLCPKLSNCVQNMCVGVHTSQCAYVYLCVYLCTHACVHACLCKHACLSVHAYVRMPV